MIYTWFIIQPTQQISTVYDRFSHKYMVYTYISPSFHTHPITSYFYILYFIMNLLLQQSFAYAFFSSL